MSASAHNQFNASACKAALWGFIAGDALGVPVEFCSREQLRRDPVTAMRGYGTHGQPAGTWSDDTSMMCCVMEWLCTMRATGKLLEANAADHALLADLFLRWYREGYHTAHGEVFDIGIATRRALAQYERDRDPRNCGLSVYEEACGNGSLMRALPFAMVSAEWSDDALYRLLHESGSITHRHPLPSLCCFFYVKILGSLLHGFSKIEAIQSGVKATQQQLFRVATDTPDWASQLDRLLQQDVWSFPSEQIRSSGYVVHTLEAVLHSFYQTSSYRDAVLQAVNLGDDTDTIAALTGGLAGAFYGMERIPSDWLEQLAGRTSLDLLIKEFLQD